MKYNDKTVITAVFLIISELLAVRLVQTHVSLFKFELETHFSNFQFVIKDEKY